MVEMAGVYGSGLELTCILREGNITVTKGTLVENGTLGKNTFAFATQVNEGDFVALDLDTGNTYSATGGIPVVEAANADGGIIGIVKSQPVLHKLPTSDGTTTTTHSTWATMLSSGFYRVATVVFPCLQMAVKAQSKGDGTAIENGAPIKWDLSEDAYVDATNTFTGAFSFHYNAADDTNILVGFGQWTGTAANADCAGMDVVA